MTIDAKVLIGDGPDSLEGVKVTTPAGIDIFREGVVISDPDDAQGRANVKQLGTQLVTADKGIITNTIIHGETTGGGGGYRDVKVNTSGALAVDASGSFFKDSNVTGTWGYLAGSNGTVNVPANGKVLQILAISTASASLNINSGSTITILANQQFILRPRGNLIAPTIVFTGTSSYIVEYVV